MKRPGGPETKHGTSPALNPGPASPEGARTTRTWWADFKLSRYTRRLRLLELQHSCSVASTIVSAESAAGGEWRCNTAVRTLLHCFHTMPVEHELSAAWHRVRCGPVVAQPGPYTMPVEHELSAAWHRVRCGPVVAQPGPFDAGIRHWHEVLVQVASY
jgi:hypothetical protein